MTKKVRGITGFKVSNSWLDRYLNRSSIQISFKLRGKGNVKLPPNGKSVIVLLGAALSQYELCNICNWVNFSNGPNYYYSFVSESRSKVHETNFGKYEDRVTIIISFNKNRSHHT